MACLGFSLSLISLFLITRSFSDHLTPSFCFSLALSFILKRRFPGNKWKWRNGNGLDNKLIKLRREWMLEQRDQHQGNGDRSKVKTGSKGIIPFFGRRRGKSTTTDKNGQNWMDGREWKEWSLSFLGNWTLCCSIHHKIFVFNRKDMGERGGGGKGLPEPQEQQGGHHCNASCSECFSRSAAPPLLVGVAHIALQIFPSALLPHLRHLHLLKICVAFCSFRVCEQNLDFGENGWREFRWNSGECGGRRHNVWLWRSFWDGEGEHQKYGVKWMDS